MSARTVRRRAAGVAAGAALALIGQLGAVPASPAAAAQLPGGRRTYVVSIMDGTPRALAVRLATYQFSASGTVTEKYWAWRQDAISGKGNVRWTKPSSGYATAGCRYSCPVRTPVGFQKGATPHTYTGRWSMESSSVLAIRWSAAYPVERWRLDTSQPDLVGVRLLSARGRAYGWGVGSNAAATTGVSLGKVFESRWITGPFAENVYGPTTRVSTIGWSSQDYALCSRSTCMQSRAMTASDRKTWYHSYFAANAVADGRKVYWNNQRGVVQQLESPKTTCISASGGGHTNALLQAIDDNGRFVGFVGVEASLNQRSYGQAVMAAYAMLSPDLLPAIGA